MKETFSYDQVCSSLVSLANIMIFKAEKYLILIGSATPCHMNSDQQVRENVFFLEPRDKRASLVAGYILMIALAGIYGRPKENTKKIIQTLRLKWYCFVCWWKSICYLITAIFLFILQPFFYLCCRPAKQIATAAILMVSAGYNIMPCSRPRLYRVVFLLFRPKNECQALRKFWHLELLWWCLSFSLIFLGRSVKNTLYISIAPESDHIGYACH